MTVVDVTLKDDLLDLEVTIDVLAPGEYEEFKKDYILTLADLDAGQVVNEAKATGTDSKGDEVLGEKEITTPLEQAPDMETTKVGKYVDVNENGMADVGDRIDYTITVTNTGNITLTDIKVVDSMIDLDETIASLAPGEFEVLTGSYEFTQDDLDAGYVINKVELEVEEIDDPDEPEEETPLDQLPSLTLIKTSDIGKAYMAGDKIIYTIRVINSGNVTLTDIKVKDDLVDLDVVIAKLAPTESKVYERSYTLTQEDVDLGQVLNKATASGKDPNGEETKDEKEITTDLVHDPNLKAEKTGVYVDVNGNKKADVGDRIDYTITVRNAGNTTLTKIEVNDKMIDVDESIDVLLPGEVRTYTGSYYFTQEDLDAGSVVNKVELEVEEMDNPDEPEEETPLDQEPGLDLKKTGEYLDKNGDGRTNVGDEIHYKIRLENTGNITLTDIEVTDPLINLNELIVSMAPGEVLILEGVYVLSKKDLEEGKVVNKVTADSDDLDNPEEYEEITELDIEPEPEKLPATGSASGMGLLLGGIGLLGGAWIALRKREEEDEEGDF